MGFRSLSVCTYLYILIQVVFHERERERDRKKEHPDGATHQKFKKWYPLRQTQHRLHKLIIINLNPSIPIGIESPERLAELLDDNARADETVKRDTGWRSTTGGSLIGFDIYPKG